MFTSKYADQLRALVEKSKSDALKNDDDKEFDAYLESHAQLVAFLDQLKESAKNGLMRIYTVTNLLQNKYVISHLVKMGFAISSNVNGIAGQTVVEWGALPPGHYIGNAITPCAWRPEMDQFFTE